jgi:hydroxymethylglutaryl-CoA reductase (NADPH)
VRRAVRELLRGQEGRFGQLLRGARQAHPRRDRARGAGARDALKTDAASLVEVQYRKNLLGSIAAGAMGYNAHYANVLSAFFLATGQDPAHVVGGSTA